MWPCQKEKEEKLINVVPVPVFNGPCWSRVSNMLSGGWRKVQSSRPTVPSLLSLTKPEPLEMKATSMIRAKEECECRSQEAKASVSPTLGIRAGSCFPPSRLSACWEAGCPWATPHLQEASRQGFSSFLCGDIFHLETFLQDPRHTDIYSRYSKQTPTDI